MLYTIGGTIWWLVIYGKAVWSPAYESCEAVALSDPNGNY